MVSYTLISFILYYGFLCRVFAEVANTKAWSKTPTARC